ncbi:MAG: 2-oxoacid:acceptor oxidoreductase family protein [Myxococcota bacterium]
MERELMLTGIGGQGVQLAAQILARAATLEDRHVLLFGVYGGAMRGGNTDSTLVVADAPIEAPPIVSSTWSALAMHHEFWEPVRAKLRPGGVVLVNSTLFEGEVDGSTHRVIEVPATQLAADLGSPLTASMVMIGAYAGATGLVGLNSLVEAMKQSVPPYRQQHVQNNAKALETGFERAPRGAAPAWNGGDSQGGTA